MKEDPRRSLHVIGNIDAVHVAVFCPPDMGAFMLEWTNPAGQREVSGPYPDTDMVMVSAPGDGLFKLRAFHPGSGIVVLGVLEAEAGQPRARFGFHTDGASWRGESGDLLTETEKTIRVERAGGVACWEWDEALKLHVAKKFTAQAVLTRPEQVAGVLPNGTGFWNEAPTTENYRYTGRVNEVLVGLGPCYIL